MGTCELSWEEQCDAQIRTIQGKQFTGKAIWATTSVDVWITVSLYSHGYVFIYYVLCMLQEMLLDEMGEDATIELEVMLPCEFCSQRFTVDTLLAHQANCRG